MKHVPRWYLFMVYPWLRYNLSNLKNRKTNCVINQFEETKGISKIFIQPNASKEDITKSEIAFLEILYDGKKMNLIKNYVRTF